MIMSLPDPTTAPPWRDSMVEPADLDVAKWLVKTSPQNRKWWFDHMRQNASTANHCWEADHDHRVTYLQTELTEARERIAWLEKNYQALDMS